MSSMLETLIKGGPVMIPIVGLSVLTVTRKRSRRSMPIGCSAIDGAAQLVGRRAVEQVAPQHGRQRVGVADDEPNPSVIY